MSNRDEESSAMIDIINDLVQGKTLRLRHSGKRARPK